MINDKQLSIYFLENSYDYNGKDLDNPKIAGSEKILINISNELAKDKKLNIKVFKNTTKPIIVNNVSWQNIRNLKTNKIPDFVIAMSDANLFYNLSCKNNYLWSHSVQTIEKFLRKKQFLPFLRFKPKMILEGEYHYKTRSYPTSLFGKKILKIAPDYEFIKNNLDINFIPPPNAIFTTKSDRNLDILIDTWKEIKKNNPNSKLFINPPYNLTTEDKKYDICLRVKGNKNLLIKDLINSKIFMSPGHKTEVFCLAAAEAKELCVPIVTLGIGCLYERVEHGITGFIAKNKKDFVYYSNLLLKDNSVYLEIRKNLFKMRNTRNLNHVKIDLLNLLNIK